MRTSFIAAAGSVVLAFAVATTASAQLVNNGGFETGDFTGWTPFGNSLFDGVAAGSAITPAHSGGFFGFFGPVGSTGGISQTIATTIGDSYTFAFWLQTDGGNPSSFEADWGGVAVTSLSNPASSGGFSLYSFDRLATSALTDISFNFRDDPGFIFLDDVSVTSSSVTPEPATMGLMATGLVGMIGAGYRRKRRA